MTMLTVSIKSMKNCQIHQAKFYDSHLLGFLFHLLTVTFNKFMNAKIPGVSGNKDSKLFLYCFRQSIDTNCENDHRLS